MGLEVKAISVALAAAGIRDLKIAFDGAAATVHVSGNRWNRPFSYAYSFTDIEEFINSAASIPSDAAPPSQPGP